MAATAPPRFFPGCWLPLSPSINSSITMAFADTVPRREEDWCVYPTGAGVCGDLIVGKELLFEYTSVFPASWPRQCVLLMSIVLPSYSPSSHPSSSPTRQGGLYQTHRTLGLGYPICGSNHSLTRVSISLSCQSWVQLLARMLTDRSYIGTQNKPQQI